MELKNGSLFILNLIVPCFYFMKRVLYACEAQRLSENKLNLYKQMYQQQQFLILKVTPLQNITNKVL